MRLEIGPYTEKVLPEFKLQKTLDEQYIKESIDADVVFYGTESRDLINKFVASEYRETGNIKQQCGETLFTKGVYIKHAEGKPDLNKCEFKKKLIFTNPLDCVVTKNINIFDYLPSATKTIRGTLEIEDYDNNVVAVLRLNSENVIDFSLDYLLSIVGPIQDRSADGWFIQGIGIIAVPWGLASDSYQVVLGVRYVRNLDSIQHSNKWIPLPSSSQFYYAFEDAKLGPAEYNVTDLVKVRYSGGAAVDFKNLTISNTYSINPIIVSMFECTGLQLVSNFFGINSDSTHPDNSAYEYAANYCSNIKICQSYDIIKESAIQDSFGLSGIIESKAFLSEIMSLYNLCVVPDVPGGKIRLEHVSYFSRKGIDIIDREYEFEPMSINERDIDREDFMYAAETRTPGFYKVSLKYENPDLYKRENISSPVELKLFISDVFATVNNPDFEKDNFKKLFFLLTCDSNDNLIEFNVPLSMKSIFYALHQYGRPSKRATLDGSPLFFSNFSLGLTGTIKMKASILMWDTIQPFYSVNCKEGTFQIVETELDQNDQLTIKIKS